MRTPRHEFSLDTMRQAWARSQGHCEACTAPLRPGAIEYDHVVPNALGGDPTLANCAVLCRTCHRIKSTKQDIPAIAQAKRRGEKHFGMRPKGRGFGYGAYRKRMDGSVVPR